MDDTNQQTGKLVTMNLPPTIHSSFYDRLHLLNLEGMTMCSRYRYACLM